MSEFVSFGDWVYQRRLALGLTRPTLAQRIHCSPSTIKKIERDERRPSRQIATLLAEHLLIAEHEREQFIGAARGESAPNSLAAPDLISLPPFLHSFEQFGRPDSTPLVAREHELAQLSSYLESAVAGHGNIVLITGEAGDGKTVLSQAFAREAQKTHADLVVAFGNCNAYTGIGDPYLPFREILELLTGDIETHWDTSSMSRTYAERLWQVAPHTVQALLDVGPDLVNTFLLGTTLIAHANEALHGHDKELLEPLQALVERKQEGQSAAISHQGNLFAQYARVLHTLVHHHPLLLIIDDLQWADAGSISLLHHLTHRLQNHPILIVGVYRAAEVALGRNGQRHPLEPLINEFQRAFGEIHIRLNQADGRRFVDALIDSEPNQLDRSFRDALYRHTAGHPLFTAEMLHGLQVRGDMMQNDDNEWIESSEMDWHILPARVEGIVKERIGRLPSPLQAMLQVASVAGESFFAEVLAHVLDVDDRQIIGDLGTSSSQEQRLVQVLGSQQVGAKQFSEYRFRHILFQQYLYNSLDSLQRAYFHRTIADELSRCYGDEAQLIAPQLARHYAIGGKKQLALHHFAVAGDIAAAIYANAEAATHYRSALASADQRPSNVTQAKQLLQIHSKLGRTLELDARYDEAIVVYEKMERFAQQHNDPAMVLMALLARATIRTTVNFARDPVEGRVLLERARTLAYDLGDRSAEARIVWNLLLLSAYTGGDLNERLAYGEQALLLARKLNLPERLAFALHDAFYAYAGAGQWDRARAALDEACDLWQQLANLPMASEAHMRLHWIDLVVGNYDQALAHAETAYRLGVESHNLDAQALSHFMIGFVYWERGEIDRALTTMEKDIKLAESVNSLTPLIGTRGELGLLYGEMGDLEYGQALAELAHKTAVEQLPILRFWPLAIQVMLHLQGGTIAIAEGLVATLDEYQTVKERFGYMPFMWIRVGLAHAEFEIKCEAYERVIALADSLYADMEEASIWYLRPDVLHLKGRALLGLGSVYEEEAREVLLEASATAETLCSRRTLGPILKSLSALESP